MTDYSASYRNKLATALERMVASNLDGSDITHQHGFELLCDWASSVRKTGRMLHFVGNGASACAASHMAADWTKNAGVKALAYNDVALITATGNDLGYEQVFAQPVSWFGEQGDLLAAISSSGNSPNILKAIAAGREKGMQVVTFSGMKPNNASRRLGDLNFYVPAWTYGIVESAHHVLLHAWLDCYMGVKDWELSTPQVIVPPVR